jgi:hypothetical protein
MIEEKPEIRKFTPTEAAWLAAVIDGEGSIGLYDYGKSGRMVQIQMGNTSELFVAEMKRIIGGGSSILRVKFAPSHKGRKPMYHYTLKGSSRCYWVLKQVVKYLIIKKQKALSIMKELESKPFGRWANATKEGREKASKIATESWKNPIIRAARIKGMQEAKCRKLL